MNDPTPPSGDKKPRRRSAPRKRAPTKRIDKSGAQDAHTQASTGVPTAGAEPAAPTQSAPASGAAAETDTAAGLASKPPRRRDRRGPKDARPTRVAAAPASKADPTAVASTLDPDPLNEAGNPGYLEASPAPVPRESVPTPESSSPDSGQRPTAFRETQPAPAAPQAREARPDTAPAQPMIEPPARTRPATDLTPPALRPGELIRVPMSVRWRDLDAFNHVNNSKYLSYLEEARLRWMLTVPSMGMDDDVAPVVAASNLNYRRPISWPADVVIELFVERLGNTSVTIGHRIVDATEGGVMYCDGNVVMVWIDRTSGRAAPLPEPVRTSCSRR